MDIQIIRKRELKIDGQKDNKKERTEDRQINTLRFEVCAYSLKFVSWI